MPYNFISFLFFSLFLNTLNADEALKIQTKLVCIENTKELYITLKSNQLNLTDEAIVDNTGGYVDIPEERFYLKTDTKIYKLQGKVVKDFNNHSNNFSALLPTQVLSALQDITQLKLVQKTDLLRNNLTPRERNITTTNIIDIAFDTSLFASEFQKCQKTYLIK